MALTLSWLGHASFLVFGSRSLYIDPWKVEGEPHDADLILISHTHYDHFSIDDIKVLRRENTEIVGPKDVVEELGYGHPLVPGESIEVSNMTIHAIPAYNREKEYHPRENGWLGFLIEMEGKRLYYAGDTDFLDEMKALGAVDLGLFPVGGTFTMDASEAVEAARAVGAATSLPYHWGDIVGSRKDAQRFVQKLENSAKLLKPGESLSIE